LLPSNSITSKFLSSVKLSVILHTVCYVQLNYSSLVRDDESLFLIPCIVNVIGNIIILGNHINKNPNFPKYRNENIWHKNSKIYYKKHEKIIVVNPIFGYFFNLPENAKAKTMKINGLIMNEYLLFSSTK